MWCLFGLSQGREVQGDHLQMPGAESVADFQPRREWALEQLVFFSTSDMLFGQNWLVFDLLLLFVVRICIHIRSFSWNLRWNADWILTMVQYVLRLEACTQTLSRIHCSCFRAVRGDDWSWRFSAQFDLSGTMSAARSQVGEWHVVGDVVFGSSMIFVEPLHVKSQWNHGQAVAHFGGRGGQVQVRHSDN